MRTRQKALKLALATIFLGGCSHVNVPLGRLDAPVDQQPHNHTRAAYSTEISTQPDGNGYFVGLALSGGGSRSANFSAACMFELERLGILQKTTCISSVSGGSLTATYYCTSDRWNRLDVQKKLTHSFAGDLVAMALQPWTLLAMSFTPLDRSDLLAKSFTNVLFSKNGRELTFNDLRPDRPRLLINATDLSNGRPFVFCNEAFDGLNSDLAKYPLAHAVAASSAVPVLLHQVTLRDYSTSFEQYCHLIDGGITDNLGVNSLIESYAQQVRRAKQEQRPDPYPNGLILIVIDAHTQVDSQINNKSDTYLIDSLSTSAGLSTTVLLNRVSTATLADVIVKYSRDDLTAKELRKDLDTLETDGWLLTKDKDSKPVRVVHISLQNLGDSKDLPSSSFGQSVNNIATYFSIRERDAYALYKAANVLCTKRFAGPLNEISRELNGATTQP